ncbi:uncharacterized protein BJ171DRAFT_73101 [Polychytrium aggregatum]|uniref:uncharacterized protein n=1 Tax=Polychytrium aggregatum TaxID=110093 RepID=UPI0022FECE30|nr:uncharacterized protein BJ171DRAFT_73101 [Polychytrium aggregatum]KAI9205401.1 hypothetical protein BJ171DRAFT_73101 [Polychytrium aggregatum]
MPSSSVFVYALVAGMLFTGTVNTILNKYQVLQCVENCDDPDASQRKYFEQPIWQTLNMFIGEALCLLVYYISLYSESAKSSPAVSSHSSIIHPDDHEEAGVVGTSAAGESTPLISAHEDGAAPAPAMTGWQNFLLWLPTLCDMTSTTLMSVGLIYISASVYQMLRGSVVLFTGTFSVLFLGHRHPLHRWIALCLVFIGVGLVGASSILDGERVSGSWLGFFLVVFAQIFTATQFVIEEKIMSSFEVPALKAVGLEGTFGFVTTLGLMPILYYTIGKSGPPGNFFDLPVGYQQVFGTPAVLTAAVGIIFSIAFFNWFGLSVTKTLSATSRSTIDTCRTLFIWIVSLALGWESFKWLQVLGFIVLIYGTFVFNDVVQLPFLGSGHESHSD